MKKMQPTSRIQWYGYARGKQDASSGRKCKLTSKIHENQDYIKGYLIGFQEQLKKQLQN